MKTSIKNKKRKTLKYVTVTRKSYGKFLKGTKVYYEGRKPKQLNDDGSFKFGKNILEILKSNFDKFHLIITKDTDEIILLRKIYRIRISLVLLNQLHSDLISRTRDIKNDLIINKFSTKFPNHFKDNITTVYVPGVLSKIINKEIINRLSTKDRESIIEFLPHFISSESISSVNLLKAETEIESLRDLAKDLKDSIKNKKSESWWQKYIKNNILIIQQGYIKPIEKMNINIGKTKFPDFSLVTHDNYLDILEIKTPTTTLMKYDSSRDNYYWDTELSKGIIQVENYINNVSLYADNIRSYLKDSYQIDLKVLRPRGIILAGNTQKFDNQKIKDDFRLLSQSMNNIIILTYDELLARLENYIKVLESFKK